MFRQQFHHQSGGFVWGRVVAQESSNAIVSLKHTLAFRTFKNEAQLRVDTGIGELISHQLAHHFAVGYKVDQRHISDAEHQFAHESDETG